MQKVKRSLKGRVAKAMRPEAKRTLANLAELPVEILLQIGMELLRDPETTIRDFGFLRRVCRSLDKVYAPIVLSSIEVFYPSEGKILAKSDQLRALTTGHERLSYVKELTLYSWDWIFKSRSRFKGPSTGQNPGIGTTIKSTIWRFVLVPAGYLLWTVYIDPTAAGRQVRKAMARTQAKRYVRQIDQVAFQLPNVRRVSWWLYAKDPESHQSVQLNLKILETLPALKELEIAVDSSHDGLEQISTTMARLHSLQRLVVRIHTTDTEQVLRLEWLRQAIAHNPNLTHLEIYQDGKPDDEQHIPLLDLFDGLSPDVPLKLEHLRICPKFYQITPTVLPHIRSLTSIDICFPVLWDPHPMDDIWQILHQERILVSEIQTNRVTEDMLSYLWLISNLRSITIYDTPLMPQERNREPAKALFPALARHSNSLRRLKLEPYNWGYWYKEEEVQTSLFRCTKLEEFVLNQVGEKFLRGCWQDIAEIAQVVSQIDSPLTFIVEGDIKLYKQLVKVCRSDRQNLSLQSLYPRIVYQRSRW